MYVPQHFLVSDGATLRELIDHHAFGLLVTAGDGLPFATHLPFALHRGEGEHGTLYAHMARANPQWRAFTGGGQALAIFQAEHGYISPAWYEAPESVPTWNYRAVHAYGKPRIIDGDDEVRRVLDELVEIHESPRSDRWSMQGVSEEYLARMRQAIVAFAMPIERLEGKFKLSQNRPQADREHVMQVLAASPRHGDRELAAAMEHWAPVRR
ncbi:FMN-binding negative transcriptional regulator [bacterium]|nr:MAG: FMN-binding negative transcriptional regulator [bacterium]